MLNEIETSGRTEHKGVYRKYADVNDVIVIKPGKNYYECMKVVDKKIRGV